MSRPLRIEYSGAWYHVMNRGRRGEEIFSSQNDFQAFVDLLQQSSSLWDVKISAYCLMSNHYHLLIQTPQGNLSRFMRHINGVYTQRYNHSHNCDGQLFRGRYKAILVEEDSYLLELVRYIHRNPLNAGLVDDINDYAWSSHSGYLVDDKRWRWLHKNFILKMLVNDNRNRIDAYRQFVQQEDSAEIFQAFENDKLPAVIGSEEFVDQVKNEYFSDKAHSQIPDSAQLAPSVEKIQQAVCSNYGVSVDELLVTRRGVRNEPRNVAIYLTRHLRREGFTEIGIVFNVQGYSAVGNVISRLEKRMMSDEGLRKRVYEIRRVAVLGMSHVQT